VSDVLAVADDPVVAIDLLPLGIGGGEAGRNEERDPDEEETPSSHGKTRPRGPPEARRTPIDNSLTRRAWIARVRPISDLREGPGEAREVARAAAARTIVSTS